MHEVLIVFNFRIVFSTDYVIQLIFCLNQLLYMWLWL